MLYRVEGVLEVAVLPPGQEEGFEQARSRVSQDHAFLGCIMRAPRTAWNCCILDGPMQGCMKGEARSSSGLRKAPAVLNVI